MPGLTRDGMSALIDLDGVSIQLRDTAGWELAPKGSLEERMRRKTETIVKQAQLALMVVDARTGLLPIDENLSRQLRHTGVKILLVANKSEGNYRISDEIYKLGLGPPDGNLCPP